MKNDGNLVLYDSTSDPLWESGTTGLGAGPPYSYTAQLQKTTPYFCIYDIAQSVVSYPSGQTACAPFPTTSTCSSNVNDNRSIHR